MNPIDLSEQGPNMLQNHGFWQTPHGNRLHISALSQVEGALHIIGEFNIGISRPWNTFIDE